jgi:hypothetical protein
MEIAGAGKNPYRGLRVFDVADSGIFFGRGGSATIDALIAFASAKKWRKTIIAYAEEYAATTLNDWSEFRTAYRDGAFKTP